MLHRRSGRCGFITELSLYQSALTDKRESPQGSGGQNDGNNVVMYNDGNNEGLGD